MDRYKWPGETTEDVRSRNQYQAQQRKKNKGVPGENRIWLELVQGFIEILFWWAILDD